jgi:CBS-domain-containing membrane protein
MYFPRSEPDMTPTRKSLNALTAADVMSREVVTLSEGTLLSAAAQVLSRAQISGAPVVNKEGHCIGVLSAADFFKRVVRDNLETFPQDKVEAWMTADPVTVAATTPVRDLARMMLDAHIHRVVVIDEQRRSIGMISSTDLLAAMAYAAKEK